eukprot:scaffold1152_cov174-Skeletonema_marinoi.AAC.7
MHLSTQQVVGQRFYFMGRRYDLRRLTPQRSTTSSNPRLHSMYTFSDFVLDAPCLRCCRRQYRQPSSRKEHLRSESSGDSGVRGIYQLDTDIMI